MLVWLTYLTDGAEDGHGSGSTKFKAENEAAKPVLAELTLARSHEYDIMSKSTNCDKHRDFTLEFSESYNNPFSGLWYCTCKCSFGKCIPTLPSMPVWLT